MPLVEPITAQRIELASQALTIIVRDERQISIPWEKCSARLAKATDAQRFHAELSPSGYGIHWPLIDEDLSINGLVRDFGS